MTEFKIKILTLPYYNIQSQWFLIYPILDIMEPGDAASSWYLRLGRHILDVADLHALFLIFLLFILIFLFSSILSMIYYFLYLFLILSGLVLLGFILLGGRFDMSVEGQGETST